MKTITVAAAFATLLAINAPSQTSNDWYPFTPDNDPAPGEIGLDDWIEKPAGRHGRIARDGDDLIYNGRPIKLWGVNLCFAHCAPEKELAERRAAFYSKYGINAVRLHKFADGRGWAGILSQESSAEYDPAGLDRMDYQIAKFKEAGIFVKLSAHFGTISVGPADRDVVPFVEEFGSFGDGKDRVTVAHSAIFYSPEIQNLHMKQTLNLLAHRNPHTGLTYAEDPAIAFIEIVNEQSILFHTSMMPLEKSPTLRRQAGERFCAWLKDKYGSHQGVVDAWGEKALNSFKSEVFNEDEHLDRATILPLGKPWYWDPDQLHGEAEGYRKQRMLDTLEFLSGLQRETYARYVAAVRAAGYTGELVASNWQAGRAYSHFANLHTDYEVGTIDRHNYFGGGRGATDGKPFNNRSMLSRAGSGMLSSGLQQVAGRPFMLSEWIHVFPNEWGAEGPAIIGAYAMGLQGWDVSYLFQNGDDGAFAPVLGRELWELTAPQVLGVLPAVARQVLRGDVREAEVVARRNVHVPSLFEGKLGFDDRVKQGYDDKELDGGTVSARALAAVRCVVEFTPTGEETPRFDLRKYLENGAVVSSTGQLRWKDGPGEREGFFTINTAGTKAVVGFAQDQACDLGEITIRPESRFAAIYVTAQGRTDDITGGQKLVVVALARARNTGMMFNEDENVLQEKGTGPIRLEPVRATITLRRPGEPKVIVLDHDGRRTNRTLPVVNGAFTIDGAKDQTPYYLVEY